MPRTFRDRLTDGLKAAVNLPYPGGRGGLWGFASGFLTGFPRGALGPLSTTGGVVLTASNYNLLAGRPEFDLGASAGNPHGNSVVTICLGKIYNCFAEPALQVQERQADGTWESVEDHPLLDQLAYPNPWDDLSSLGAAWAASYKVDGNAYLVLDRTRGAQIDRINWIQPDLLEPRSNDPTQLITHYIYRPGDGQEIELEPSRVLHWRAGKDPANPRLGCSKFKQLVLELATDNEAARFNATILHGMGIVGGILSYTGDGEGPTKEDAEGLKERYRTEFTGGKRGGLMVPTFPAKYEELGRSPEQLMVDVIRQVPTARLCAALDVDPQAVGLAESSSYANKAEAREAFWEECMVPLGTRFTDGLTRYLLPLYGDEIRGARRRRVAFDYQDVRALQPDMDKISARKVREWLADGITLDQFLEGIGEKGLEGEAGKVYYTEHAGKMKPTPVPIPGGPPESPGDSMANGRTPPFGREAGLNGAAAP